LDRANQKAYFASKWNKKSEKAKLKSLENAGAWQNAEWQARLSFEKIGKAEQDMILMKHGFNVNKKVDYGYKLKGQYDPRHPKETEIHYMERTGQILSSRKWSGTKKHMVNHRTGQDYIEW